MIGWNIASWFVGAIPRLPVLRRRTIRIGRGFPHLWFQIHPMTIAFGYFTKSDVLLSIWVFHLLAILQVGGLNRLGFDIGGSDPWCSFHPAVGWQSFGGMVVFVAWGLWIARRHLIAAFGQAFSRTHVLDDSGEILSYRAASRLFLGCAAYAVIFSHQTGMGWPSLLVFWTGTLVLYLGLARIIVESGLVYLRGPISAQSLTWHTLGIAGMGPLSAVGLAQTFTFFCDAKTFAITALAHIPRLAEAMAPERRRHLVSAVLLACAVGAASVTGFVLHQGYHTVGSYNFGVVSFNGSSDGAVGIWRLTANRIQQGTAGTDWARLQFLGLGAAFTAFLFYLRYRFPGFPVHPIGFTISASGVLRSTMSSIFLVWLTKALLLKFGGLETYRRMVPLFMGILIGYLAGIGLGLIVDVIWFHGNGHQLNGW